MLKVTSIYSCTPFIRPSWYVYCLTGNTTSAVSYDGVVSRYVYDLTENNTLTILHDRKLSWCICSLTEHTTLTVSCDGALSLWVYYLTENTTLAVPYDGEVSCIMRRAKCHCIYLRTVLQELNLPIHMQKNTPLLSIRVNDKQAPSLNSRKTNNLRLIEKSK
jgi:hypothetical protein